MTPPDDMKTLAGRFTDMVWGKNSVAAWAEAFRKLREESPAAYDDFELSLLTLDMAMKASKYDHKQHSHG